MSAWWVLAFVLILAFYEPLIRLVRYIAGRILFHYVLFKNRRK